jgi:hypothetical protein
MAIKTLSVKKWDHVCPSCGKAYDLEDCSARMAPDVPFFVAPTEAPYATVDAWGHASCPHCQKVEQNVVAKLGKGASKKVELSLLVHPDWLAGSPSIDEDGKPFGGSAQDDAESTARWNQERASKIRLLEVRGKLPEEVTCPKTGVTFAPEIGTVPKKSHFACGADGAVQDVLDSVKATKKTGPMGGYAIQGYAPRSAARGDSYNGRFFAPYDKKIAHQYDWAYQEWDDRKESDLAGFWPKSELPYGFMTHHLQGGVPNHGFTHWWTMFNPRQLLVHTQILKAIMNIDGYTWESREYVLGAFQQYLRNQCLFSFWNPQRDTPEPMFSNNNYHPKSTVVENSVFARLGRGNWSSCIEGLIEGNDWAVAPCDTIAVDYLERIDKGLSSQSTAKGEKVYPSDKVLGASVIQASSTDLKSYAANSIDLVMTDPPFGGLLHYSELSDFFYVWLRIALKDKYPDVFASEYTPKSLEVVANKAREPEDSDGFYQRLLTNCWKEAHRILKPAGILAFTFHHSEDEPWVAVLESLFDAEYYLEATYPIRSDETKGEGEFGSKTIEYDIIHVCRKRTEEPTPVSWGRMRREVLADVRNLQNMLEMHAKEGLPAADLQVIRRGKALEYFSRHYGKVFVDDEKPISVREALIGINQLIDEDTNKTSDPPPINAEPVTRQFLRIFDGKRDVQRDQLQKFLKGSITTPDEFEARNWCTQKDKVYFLIDPLQYAIGWKGKERTKLTSDLDQALFMVGACVEGSGINANDTLRNGNFKPHVALKNLLEWLSKHLPNQNHREAARRASTILKSWIDNNRPNKGQMDLFGEDAL